MRIGGRKQLFRLTGCTVSHRIPLTGNIHFPTGGIQGKVVDLGDFGSFWLRFRAQGAEASAKVRGDLITTLLPRFIPGKEFKRLLRTVKFEKLR